MNQITNSEMHRQETIKGKTLMNTLKESRKKVNKSSNFQNNNIKFEDNKKEKNLFNSKIYNEENFGESSEKFKEEEKTLKLKKIKIVDKENQNNNNNNKKSSSQPNSSSNLRKIYVDLNEEDLINEDNHNIIANQKMIYNNNSIRTCQYTLLTFLPLALMNQFKTAFNWFFLIYNIIAVIPELSDLEPAAEVTPFIVVLILNKGE